MLSILVIGIFFEIGFHFYRIYPIIALLVIVMAVNFTDKKASLCFLSFVFVVMILANMADIKPEGVPDVYVKDFGRLEGRVIVAEPRENFEIGRNTASNIISLRTLNYGLKSQFMDSMNAWLLGGFYTELSGHDYHPFFYYNKTYY